MNWTLSDDPERYADMVLPLLSRRPQQNTLPLTALESLRAGYRWGPGELVFGWYTANGTVTGAVSITPPFGILLAALPPATERELVEQLRGGAVPVVDVAGPEADVRRFAECWTAGTGLATEVVIRQRLYSLEALVPPDPLPAGSARLAESADLDLVLSWMAEFQQQAEPGAAPVSRPIFQRRVELGLIWFWTDPAGVAVSMAGRNVTVAGTSRIGPVYTPVESRRHGYGAAVTAACTQDALDLGAGQVVLFTDLANPTSNAIYQQLGYRPLDDRLVLRFVG